MCHCLTLWGIWDIFFFFLFHSGWFSEHSTSCEKQGSRKLTVSHNSLVHASGEKTSGCFHEQHCLTSSHPSHSSISASPRAVAFPTQVCWAVAHAACCLLALLLHSPAYFCLHLSTGCTFDLYLGQQCEPLDPVNPSLSLLGEAISQPAPFVCMQCMSEAVEWG